MTTDTIATDFLAASNARADMRKAMIEAGDFDGAVALYRQHRERSLDGSPPPCLIPESILAWTADSAIIWSKSDYIIVPRSRIVATKRNWKLV
jgi:hypothetical protein